MKDNEQVHALPHGSYNLFHQTSTSNMFHLIIEGDYDDERFIEAMIGYSSVDDILLPRAMGGGSAPKVNKRIPVIILAEDNNLNTALAPFVCAIDVTTLIDP
jgi:hypothetical protein